MSYAPKWFGVDGMDGILTMEGFDTTLAEGVMLLTPFNADADGRADQGLRRPSTRRSTARSPTSLRLTPMTACTLTMQALTNAKRDHRHGRLRPCAT